jgi:hypothetical protein
MRSTGLRPLRACLGFAALLAVGAAPAAEAPGEPWASDFAVDRAQMSSTGRNPYFILEPGYRVVLEGGTMRMTVMVLDETKIVDGVETRVVEERETVKGQTTELSRNFFAFNKQTHDVMHFGEEVSNFKNGKVVNNKGSWTAGTGKARAGLMLPGQAHVGYRYYQEQAPGITMDRAEILSMTTTQKTPSGTFEKCMRVKVTSPDAPGEAEYRWYAPEVGLVKFESMLLVEHGFGDRSQPGKTGGASEGRIR